MNLVGMNNPTEEWVLRPVMAGKIKFESLLDGTVGIEHVAMLHEALDIEAENRARVDDAYRNRSH